METLGSSFSINKINPSLTYEQKAREAAQDFEAFFLYQVFEIMSPEVDQEGMFSGGYAESLYKQMLNEEASKAVAKSGGVGIADYIYDELIQIQEAGL